MNLVYTLPFLLRSEPEYFQQDRKMADLCLSTLQSDQTTLLVVYNQGPLPNDKLHELLVSYHLTAVVLGDGRNVGIAEGRQSCFQYIWQQYPDIPFIAEIHLDMAFPPGWYVPLLNMLNQSDEPCLSPGIVTSCGALHPLIMEKALETVPQEKEDLVMLLKNLAREELREGFVHPVIHKSEVLKQVGGYDCRFLQGKQGYEDDSLLLGYSYYLGTRRQWRPKCYLASWVYHATMAQRFTLADIKKEFDCNLQGLAAQYGGYGFKELARIHDRNNDYFNSLFNIVIQKMDGVKTGIGKNEGDRFI